MKTNPQSLLYNMQQLREMIGQDERTIRRWLATNDVPISKIGRRYVVWKKDLFHAFPELEASLELVSGDDN